MPLCPPSDPDWINMTIRKCLQYWNVTLLEVSRSQMVPDHFGRAIPWAESLPVCSVLTTDENDVWTSLHAHALNTCLGDDGRDVVPTVQIWCLPLCLAPWWCSVQISARRSDLGQVLCPPSPRMRQKSLFVPQGPRRLRMWEVTQMPSQGTENLGELSLQDLSKFHSSFFFFKNFFLHWFYYATEAVNCANSLLLIA